MVRKRVDLLRKFAIAFMSILLYSGLASAQLPNPNQGPGGPILVITSSASTYGTYYAEILRTEGLNEFAVLDIGAVTAATLSSYDVVVLAPSTLSGTQVTMFTNWLNNGGNLIAMRPDPQLASLLGLTSTGSTLANAYLAVTSASGPGNGIVNQPIQFHGTASIFNLNGAASVATLYSDPTTSTANPAVTVHNVGTNGGHAAAFAYDLATSVVYTRQGNPAWAAQERDGVSPIRSDDKFFGSASGDPQPDWVDLTNEVSVPQADEQQRLLANLILQINLAKKPLPRFWYFPRGKKAALIMTGDDHGNGGTAGRFDEYLQSSQTGCNVANWECIRSTSYIFTEPQNLSNTQAVNYNAQGFEIGLHLNTNCGDFTPASLDTFYSQQLADFKSSYPGIPTPTTMRHHCIVWSDWLTTAKTELKYGIRLDTSYYFWPPGWVQNRPGHFTGSAMPMRFADLDGTIVDVYNATTQMTDESGQTYPFTTDALLNAALGPQGYYGAFTVNAHTDSATNPVSDGALSSALSHGIPVVSSVQMLNWLDARNSSSFSGLNWNSNALTFTVSPASNANGLEVMLPTHSASGVLGSISGPGGNVALTFDTIKGVEYALFSAAAGTFVATYTADTTPPTVTSTTPGNGATGVSQSAAVSAIFNKAVDPATINNNTFLLRDSSNTPVASTVTYIANSHTAVLAPTNSLAPSAAYNATLTTAVKDLAGNALASNFNWSFMTATGPSCPCTAWSSSTAPANPSVNDPNAVELGVKFTVELDGVILGVRFYKGPSNTGTHVGNLWSISGQLLATATFSNETSTGWQQVTFSSPVAVKANTVYVASYHTNVGNYAGDNGFFATTGVDSPPVHLLRDGVSGGNGVYAYSASSIFPSNTYQSSNYWVDVVFAVGNAPSLASITVTPANPTIATGGTQQFTATGRYSDNSTQNITGQVTWASSATAVATINSAGLASGVGAGSTTISASQGQVTGSTTLTVTSAPPPPLSVTAMTPANNATGVNAGTTVSATFNNALNASTVTSSTFTLTGPNNTPVSGTYSVSGSTATLTPAAALAASTTYAATLTTGIKDVNGSSLASNSTWSFTTAAVAAGCTSNCTIWPSTATPATPDDGPDNPVELGMKFRADSDGTVSAIRFYKASTNTGAHVGHLWSSTGQLLATATFTGETASGWQQVILSPAVPIAANTVYVVSYHTTVGHYADDQNFFATAGVDNPPLHALQNGVSGVNGVYAYGSGTFPNQGFNASNYWVDVVFSAGNIANTGFLAPTANAPVTTGAGDNNGYQTTPANAYALDALLAVDPNSGTGTGTSCTATSKDKHDFYTFNVSLPAGASIRGIEVQLNAKADSTSNSPKICVQLSWDGGTTWTAAQTTATLTTSTAAYNLGGAANNWGRTWAATDFSNPAFRVRLINVASSTARTFSLDALAVRISYQ
jgi:hypothetical protein